MLNKSKENNMTNTNKLNEKQIIDILKNNKISQCSTHEKKQVFAYAFGEDYMASSNKGKKQLIKQ
jgi:hypothetical protein